MRYTSSQPWRILVPYLDDKLARLDQNRYPEPRAPEFAILTLLV